MTFDEARLRANVNDRAQRLFADGYRARWKNRTVLSIRSPKGDAYLLDTEAETCACPFFQKHAGAYSCKHFLGHRKLLSHQRSSRLLVALMLLRVWTDLDDNASGILNSSGSTTLRELKALAPAIQEVEAENAVS